MRARLTCTRCCRCRQPFSSWVPPIPTARSWLAAHWGITDRLRQVVARPQPGIGRRLAKNHTAIGYGFFTDGETPHAAIAQLGARWPALRFVLVPRPDD